MDLTSKPFIAQICGLAFALLAMFHIALPPTFQQPAVVGVVMLVIALATAILRFGHPGAPAADAKVWWMSKTIWTAIIAAIFGLIGLFGISPPLDQGNALAIVMTGLTGFGAVFGAIAHKPIA